MKIEGSPQKERELAVLRQKLGLLTNNRGMVLDLGRLSFSMASYARYASDGNVLIDVPPEHKDTLRSYLREKNLTISAQGVRSDIVGLLYFVVLTL
ncbi:MAG: hypothetical protein PHT88_01600 [Candidatus Moranbacteria bacterium]|nr:hypothetical protein [Candidatus Moranbacteria bacterium]